MIGAPHMLESLLGNATIEKILLYLHVYGEGYGRQISRIFGIPFNGVYQQVRRLENGGIIAGVNCGRTRILRINPRYPFKKELTALLARAMEFIPEESKKRYFTNRTRPQ